MLEEGTEHAQQAADAALVLLDPRHTPVVRRARPANSPVQGFRRSVQLQGKDRHWKRVTVEVVQGMIFFGLGVGAMKLGNRAVKGLKRSAEDGTVKRVLSRTRFTIGIERS